MNLVGWGRNFYNFAHILFGKHTFAFVHIKHAHGVALHGVAYDGVNVGNVLRLDKSFFEFGRHTTAVVAKLCGQAQRR